MATLAGQTLGKYQVIERLGRGGMAEVYKAYHPQLERYAAIKVLHHFLAEGQDFTARFQREARAIAALQHPNIVQVYDFESQDDLYYMVMEFVDGGTLKDRLMQPGAPLLLEQTARITREMAAALAYAHHQGVLHRDIKPANVLLGKDGRVVLTDFGIARILSDTQFTATGTLVGTPAYMSPEQGKGMPVSVTSDIYSLGVILYEMVTGKVPFDSDTPLAVIHKHINEPLPRPSSLNPDTPPALEAVIEKALEKEPANRYRQADELVRALDEALAGVAAPPQEVRRVPDVGAPSPRESTPDVYSKATLAMTPEEEPAPVQTIASRPTVAMETEEADLAEKATVAMPVATPSAPQVQKSRAPQPPRVDRPAKKANRAKLFLGIVAALVVFGLLIWGGMQLTGADCDSLEACHQMAEAHMSSGNFEGAITAIEAAINYVPENEHPPHAQFWCLKGEAHLALEQFDMAIWSFEDCQAWTEGDPDPGMEELRMFAHEQIEMINSR